MYVYRNILTCRKWLKCDSILTFYLPTFSLGMRPPVLLFPSTVFYFLLQSFFSYISSNKSGPPRLSYQGSLTVLGSCLASENVCFFFDFFYILKLLPRICAKVYARRCAACCRCVFHRNLLICEGCTNDSQQCVGIMTWEMKSNWAGSRKWQLMTLMTQSDIKDYKRRKEHINQRQSLAGWEMRFFRGTLHERDKYFKSRDHIAPVLLVRAEEKAWCLLWQNSFYNPISLGVISVSKYFFQTLQERNEKTHTYR